jgi:RimJ/RimL family protein N-acetyltransferase
MSHTGAVDSAATNPGVSPPDDSNWCAEFRLDDGRRVHFRHVRPEDEPLVAYAWRTASRETLLHRFFSPVRSVAPDQLRAMLAIDRAKQACIVGLISDPDKTRLICGARYVRVSEPDTAEVAITVHDDFQHRGLGTFLLQQLACLALADGIRWFEAYVMNSNQKMLNLFTKLAPGHVRTCQPGDVTLLRFKTSTLAQKFL